MAPRSNAPLVALTVLSTLWIDAVAVGYLLELATPLQLLAGCWLLSVPLVPLAVADGGQDRISAPLVLAMELPVTNVLAGLWYALVRYRSGRANGQGILGPGICYGLGIVFAGLSLVVAPFLTGPLALGCGYRLRSTFNRRQGSLLLAVAGTLTLAGLLVNVVVFVFLEPGPVV